MRDQNSTCSHLSYTQCQAFREHHFFLLGHDRFYFISTFFICFFLQLGTFPSAFHRTVIFSFTSQLKRPPCLKWIPLLFSITAPYLSFTNLSHLVGRPILMQWSLSLSLWYMKRGRKDQRVRGDTIIVRNPECCVSVHEFIPPTGRY